MAYVLPEYASDLMSEEILPYAVGVGAICNEWASLESAVRMLFFKASGMPAERTGFGIVHCLDIRDLCRAIKLAIMDKTELGKFGTETAIGIIDYIDNVLRPMRNRFVHDLWRFDQQNEAVERWNHTPRTFKSQSHQPTSWTPLNITQENLEELWMAVREIRKYQACLYRLQGCFNDEFGAVRALLQRPPEQLFPRPPSGKPDPSGSGEKALKRPPKSSRRKD